MQTMADESSETDITMDSTNLYKEEMFTDRQVGTIQRLTPVDGEGHPVEGGKVIFIGQTQLMTRAGPLPLSFELDADTLVEAAEKFAAGANQAMEDTVRRLEDMRREQSSSIIVPEAAAGGAPSGGQIKMP